MIRELSFERFKYMLYTPLDVENLPLIVVLHGSGGQ